jgi:hypothetical protein
LISLIAGTVVAAVAVIAAKQLSQPKGDAETSAELVAA